MKNYFENDLLIFILIYLGPSNKKKPVVVKPVYQNGLFPSDVLIYICSHLDSVR